MSLYMLYKLRLVFALCAMGAMCLIHFGLSKRFHPSTMNFLKMMLIIQLVWVFVVIGLQYVDYRTHCRLMYVGVFPALFLGLLEVVCIGFLKPADKNTNKILNYLFILISVLIFNYFWYLAIGGSGFQCTA